MANQLIRIVDPDDPRIAHFRAVRERDLVGRDRRFIAEGKVVLNVLFSTRRFEVESALILDRKLEGLQETLALAPDEMPLYVASQTLMNEIAGFPIHRGVLALGKRRPDESADTLLSGLPESALVVALSGISNHDNIGAIFRNAAAFEADAVLLDATCCDPLYRKAIRVSVGAALKIPFAIVADETALFTSLERTGFTQIALSPSGREDIINITRTGPVALWLGSEGHGLTPATMARMRTARIAMSDSFDSLNVATAGAIALHQLWNRN